MRETLNNRSVKTIEDLLQHQMIEKEAIVRLLIKKGVFTPEEFAAEVQMLSQRIEKQQK